MHGSSKERRQKLARQWKRALFAGMWAASFATSTFVWGEESVAPARKKLPTRSVTPFSLTRPATFEPPAAAEYPATLAPVLRPADLKAPAEKTSSSPATAPEAPAKLLGAKGSPFRPIAIEVIPAESSEAAQSGDLKPVVAAAAAPAALPAARLEVKAKPIPAKREFAQAKPAESTPEETLAPIVSAASLSRPGKKTLMPKEEVVAAPVSPWMEDIRAKASEVQEVEAPSEPTENVATADVVPPEAAPAALPTNTAPGRLTIFERAASPAVAESTESEPAEREALPQEPAPIVQSPKAKPLPQEALEPRLIKNSSKPLRAKPLAVVEAKSTSKAKSSPQETTSPKPERLVLAVQNEGAQPAPADTLPGPDKDKDLKKHFEVIQQTGEFSVQVHRSKLLRTAKDIYRTAVVDDAVLEIVQFTPREISLIGRAQGTTHVTFWFDDPATAPVTYLVTVEPDAGQVRIDEEKYQMLEDMINEMFPDSKIKLQLIANKLVVRGQARDSEEAFQIMTLIRAQGGFGGGGAGGGGFGGGAGFAGINEGQAADPLQDSATGAARRSNYQLINMLRVPGVQQVALRVKIAELNRTAARNFGMNVQGHIDVGDSSKILLNSVLGTGGGQSQPSVLFNIDGDDISLSLNTLQQHGVIKLLSEPTLVTLSGNPATFIAGGEFAVPTIVGSAGLNAVTTDFRAFGAIISFLPTVVDKDRVRLQVAPEFSQINTGLTVNNTPGLKVRAATTTVEMREGQTLAIAGLLEDSITANTAGDIPFLWKLIGKRGVSRAETELIILVTPELVHPMEPEEVPPLPGFDVTEPTSCQFYLHGDIEGNPTMDYRSTVWPMLKKRYKAGGPAMTSGPFGHGQ